MTNLTNTNGYGFGAKGVFTCRFCNRQTRENKHTQGSNLCGYCDEILMCIEDVMNDGASAGIKSAYKKAIKALTAKNIDVVATVLPNIFANNQERTLAIHNELTAK
jgi:hypothetical protein